MKTLALLMIATTCIAAEPAAVRDAKREFETRQKWAQEQYDATVKKAKAEYLARLKTALDAALTAKKLDDANAIDAEIKAASVEAADPAKIQRSLVGSNWTQREYPCKMTLKDASELDSHTNPNPAVRGKGTWVVIDESRVRISFPGFQSQVFSFDGKTLKSDSMTWDRAAR